MLFTFSGLDVLRTAPAPGAHVRTKKSTKYSEVPLRHLRKRNQDSRYETNERNERNETKHKNFWDSWNEQSEKIGDPGPPKIKIGDPGPPKTKKLAIRTAPKKTINDPGPPKIFLKAFLKKIEKNEVGLKW